MAKAKLLLKNDVGLVLDITESPLGCTVYDLEGNQIGGGGGGVAVQYCDLTIINTTGTDASTYTDYLDDGYINPELIIPGNNTVNVKAPYKVGAGGVHTVALDMSAAFTASNQVNCSADEFSITQTSSGPSSITLTI